MTYLRTRLILFLTLAATCGLHAYPVADPIFVDIRSGGGDGSTWALAYNDLQAAIDAANPGDHLVVAGTPPGQPFTPANAFEKVPGVESSRTFYVNKRLHFWFGYRGLGADADNPASQRDTITVLSGEIGEPEFLSDNAFTVLTIGPDADSPTFRGKAALTDPVCRLVIRDGFADGGIETGQPIFDVGGGILIEPTDAENFPFFDGVEVRDNFARISGGGMAVLAETTLGALPVMSNCRFYDNTAERESGGGYYNETRRDAYLINIGFRGNNSGRQGGAVYNAAQGSLILVNGVFYGNNADQQGGAIYCALNSTTLIINNTIVRNTALNAGPGLFVGTGADVRLQNTIIYDNTDAATPDQVRGASVTDTNLITMPTDLAPAALFVDIEDPLGPDGVWGNNDDGLIIASEEALPIDSANLELIEQVPDTADIDRDNSFTEAVPCHFVVWQPRVIFFHLDLGAYEYRLTPFVDCKPDQITVPSAGGEFEIMVCSNVRWDLDPLPDWIEIISPDCGNGQEDGKLLFLVDPNPIAEPRHGYIAGALGNCLRVDQLAGGSPPAPTTINASRGTFPDRIEVSWSEVAVGLTYTLERSTSPSFTPISIIATEFADTVYNDTAIDAGRTYYYRVRVDNGVLGGIPSRVVSGFASVPGVSTLTASDGAFADRIEISWNAVEGATSYALYRSPTTDRTEATRIANELDTTSYTDLGLSSGATFTYWVIAFHPFGNSGFGLSATGRTTGSDLFAGATALGSGWIQSPWFGTLNTSLAPWYNHEQHNFVYIPVGQSTTAIYIYDPVTGWWYTTSTIYPSLYAFDVEGGSWLFYVVGTSNPREFIDLVGGDTVTFP